MHYPPPWKEKFLIKNPLEKFRLTQEIFREDNIIVYIHIQLDTCQCVSKAEWSIFKCEEVINPKCSLLRFSEIKGMMNGNENWKEQKCEGPVGNFCLLCKEKTRTDAGQGGTAENNFKKIITFTILNKSRFFF